MSTAILKIDGDTSGLARAFGDMRAQAKATETAIKSSFDKATAAMGAAAQRAEGVYRRSGRAIRDDSAKVAQQQERDAHRTVVAFMRAEDQKRRAAQQSASTRAALEKQATSIAEAEARKRGLSAESEARVRQNALERLTKAQESAERRQTATVQRENRTRAAFMRGASRVLSSAGSAGLGVARAAHEQIQDARERRAARETSLNTTLLQLTPSGATAQEIAQLRAQILGGARSLHLDPDRVIGAVGEAQSFANALGGDTAEQRRANVAATMRDVDFASTIDPENISGLVRVGALTRGKMSEEDRSALLRSFAGISFQGSVETDTMITRGLPGLQEAWSTATANITDPAEASRRRLEVARDFAAQVQAQAASGRSTNVSANRTNSVRNALANEDRQNRLGAAYARRLDTMTPEQRAAFNSTFTRNAQGQYRMNENVSGRASDAARFFGLMHGNNVTQMRNFLGAHGGGGDRQLMLNPDVAALASYMAMTTNSRGEQVRQYDYVNELQRSTVTPEQERIMRDVRGSEESRKINDEKNARDLALGDNTSALNRVSDALTRFDANNPILSKAAPAAAGVVATVVGAAGVALGGLGASFAANEHAARTGETIGGEHIGTGERVLRGAAAYLPGAQLVGAGLGVYDAAKAASNGGLERAINALNSILNNGITATVSPVDQAHATAQAPVPR
jgi:hypothetical protein